MYCYITTKCTRYRRQGHDPRVFGTLVYALSAINAHRDENDLIEPQHLGISTMHDHKGTLTIRWLDAKRKSLYGPYITRSWTEFAGESPDAIIHETIFEHLLK